MSALVCGKRSSSVFDELVLASSPPSKRIRCAAAGSSPTSLSPPAFAVEHPSSENRVDSNGGSGHSALISRLRPLFPDMDPQLLEEVLEASGNDLDSAIRGLNDLRLEFAEGSSGSTLRKSGAGSGTNVQLSSQGIMANCGLDVATENPSAADKLPMNGSEWVELFVREMMSASDVDDARARASRLLGVLEKSVASHAAAEAVQSIHKENMMLKEQIEGLLQENNILKRAVAIQHERQKEYDEKNQELQHLKQLVSQYKEQVRTLEVNNYALTMHLRQAQQSSSIPGRFHPDLF